MAARGARLAASSVTDANANDRTHARPGFAKLSVRDGLKVQIAPVHPDFVCGIVPLSLMGLACWLPIA